MTIGTNKDDFLLSGRKSGCQQFYKIDGRLHSTEIFKMVQGKAIAPGFKLIDQDLMIAASYECLCKNSEELN